MKHSRRERSVSHFSRRTANALQNASIGVLEKDSEDVRRVIFRNRVEVEVVGDDIGQAGVVEILDLFVFEAVIAAHCDLIGVFPQDAGFQKMMLESCVGKRATGFSGGEAAEESSSA